MRTEVGVPFLTRMERDIRENLFLRWGSVLSHVGFVTGLKLCEFGFLIGRQNLHDFGLDALVLDLQLNHGLRVLGGEGGRLGFIERTASLERVHGGVILVHLLHQRLQGRLLFFPDGLDLALLITGQIELFEHMVKVAGTAKPVRTLRRCDRDGQQNSGSDSENADTSLFHWNSL